MSVFTTFNRQIALPRSASVGSTDSDKNSRVNNVIRIIIISSKYGTLLCNLSYNVILLNYTFLH